MLRPSRLRATAKIPTLLASMPMGAPRQPLRFVGGRPYAPGMNLPGAAGVDGNHGTICENCTFDQTMISFDVIQENRGWNPATAQSMVTFPSDLVGKVYCTGCWAVYDATGSFDRGLTARFRVLSQPLGTPPGPGYSGPPDDYDEFN